MAEAKPKPKKKTIKQKVVEKVETAVKEFGTLADGVTPRVFKEEVKEVTKEVPLEPSPDAVAELKEYIAHEEEQLAKIKAGFPPAQDAACDVSISSAHYHVERIEKAKSLLELWQE